MNVQEKIDKIIGWLTDYKESTNCQGVVLGISGGKDSTVVAMLAKKVWGDNVLGIMMPDGEQRDIADSVAICSALHLRCSMVNIGGAVDYLVKTINASVHCADVSQKAITNIAPRVRMTTLYAIAQSTGYRVIGTGNASEAFIGWTTKWGDSAYDLNPIYHLTCTEVVEIGKVLAEEFGLNPKYVEKSPSDGLTGRTDEDNFGFTYEQLDRVIKGDCMVERDVQDKIQKMWMSSRHKTRMPYTMEK
jgi:NAD+ synthase